MRARGLPYPDAAPASFRAALVAYEAAPGPATRDALLAHSGRETTITLWHLLQRAEGDERARVFARLGAVAPLPAAVKSDDALRLVPAALDRWKDALQPTWTMEAVPAWKRAWRRLWVAAMRIG